jgi:hypothetical protein
MAVLNSGTVTLLDWAKGQAPGGGQESAVAELLSQENAILEDMPWQEGNLTTGHRTTVRTGLAGATWRMFNQGVPVSKGAKAQIDESVGMLESWGECDVALAKLGGNPQAFRTTEGYSHTEALNQEMAGTLWYGNSGTAPSEFNGFATRYSALGRQVISAGGSGSDNASIWLIGWGPLTTFGTYPNGSAAGLQHHDHGETTIETVGGVGGSRIRMYQDQWIWNCGLVVRDYRYNVRIANIDISNLVAESSAANLTKQLIRAYHRIPGLKGGKDAVGNVSGVRPVIYMNRTVISGFDIQRYNVATGTNGSTVYGGITESMQDGEWRPSFRGIPIKISDQLLETEAAVA